ncbi:MAG: hypothetical protein HN742_10835 [Lentisphaerae bacterium]|jgi:DNA polymerase/3'-5' exonuclease PolX|nr:hypothetical protein [Lentisphaerota bacterium]MBT7056701.1 hypothetical protein [Lentisphaerota bacterium]MBT7842359.1 hypothetical protein [Lentisphaerota bacterium]
MITPNDRLVLRILAESYLPKTTAEIGCELPESWNIADANRVAMQGLVRLIAAGYVTGPDHRGRYTAVKLDTDRPTPREKIPLEEARGVAEQLQRDLAPFASRLEVAGSIRRRKPEVGDIELVALIEPELDMLGEPATDQAEPDIVRALRTRASYTVKSGRKYTQVVLDEPPIGAVTVDLFLTSAPSCWGRLFFLRTGSSDFVMRADSYYKEQSRGTIQDLRYHAPDGHLLDTPEEADVFRIALGIAPVSPERRTPRT